VVAREQPVRDDRERDRCRWSDADDRSGRGRAGNATLRQLIVNGTLTAIGTSLQPITFTSSVDSAPGQWNGIQFRAGSGSSALKYVNVRYGGGGSASQANSMVEIKGGTVTVEDSTFSQSLVSGLGVVGDSTGAGVSATIRRSKFESNGYGGTRPGTGSTRSMDASRSRTRLSGRTRATASA
jgi:hypothetical protein